MNYTPPPQPPMRQDILMQALTPQVQQEKLAVQKVLNKYGVNRKQMLQGIPQGQTKSPTEIYQ